MGVEGAAGRPMGRGPSCCLGTRRSWWGLRRSALGREGDPWVVGWTWEAADTEERAGSGVAGKGWNGQRAEREMGSAGTG